MKKSFLIVMVVAFNSIYVIGQQQPMKDELKHPFKKKFRMGTTFNLLWSSIDGKSLPVEYFAKPSVGIFFVAEYFPKPFIGVSVGGGYQQLGAGIITKITQPVTGQLPDSTYRTRLRFNTFALPISIHLRTPKDIILPGWRLGFAASLIPTLNVSSRQVYNSLEPSLRVLDDNQDVSKMYFKNDLLYQIALGPEIEAGTGILKFQFVYTAGTTNVFTANQGNGTNQAYGIRIGYLF